MNEIISEYSAGLFALACEEGEAEEVLSQSREVKKLLDADYLHLLINPAVPKRERVGCVTEAFEGRVNRSLLNFMRLMTERGVADFIPACFDEYERLYYDAFGIVRVRAVSAYPLSDEQKERLQAKLGKSTGGRVEIEYSIDSSLLGGMKLDFGGRMIDDSVKTKLRDIGDRLAQSVL